MRISKRVRDEAIEAALMMADFWIGRARFAPVNEGPVLDLARDAGRAAHHAIPGGLNSRDWYLEAASLLRDGWSPGDLVVRK